MYNDKLYHFNDLTVKYQTLAQPRLQYEYLELPGIYKISYPQEIVLPNLESGRVDSLYLTNTGILIDLEEESGPITEKVLEKFGKYIIFERYMYGKPVMLVVLCHQKPKSEEIFFYLSDSDIIRVFCIYFSEEELEKKHEKLINKVEQKQELTRKEAMDICFISKFVPKEKAEKTVESLTDVFKNAIIKDYKLKIDVAAVLGAMIVKHVENKRKQKRLLEDINMKQYESDMEKLLYEEFGDDLRKKDEELELKEMEIKVKDEKLKVNEEKLKVKDEKINELEKYNEEYKSGLEKIKNLKNLPPEIAVMINNLLVL